jgi:hypothetical protein
MRKVSVWVGVIGLALPSVAFAQLGKPGAPKAEPAKQAPAQKADAAPRGAEIRTAHDLLLALERAGDSIDTLQARVVYDRRFKLQGDRHIRRGKLYFQNLPDANAQRVRTFAILFEDLQVAERFEKSPQTWVFDGRWLVEMRVNEKQFIKREIARPGEPFDPLKIGEGPMPIPIGQKAEEIERRYFAELMEPRSGLPGTWNIPAWLDNTWQVVLTPRNPDADEFTGIRLWYDRETLLPRMAITLNRAGDESIVFLDEIKQNEPLPRDRLSVEEPPANSGWQVQIERLPELDMEEGELDAPNR